MADIASTYGALLLGGMFAAGLSGVVTIQAFVYIKLYPMDMIHTKLLVAFIWLLDAFHTGFVFDSIWKYLITNFGDESKLDEIPWSVALTIAFTAILTFCVHCFFAHRIYKLSRRNVWITGSITIFAVLRLCAAAVTTAEMIRLKTFSAFVADFKWVFTLGLALSSAVDIMIAAFLCYTLRSNRNASSSMDHVINLLILYTLENGALTCAATIVSMLCWLLMPHNRIFMGLHFVISKLYANSLLATLNTRKKLQQERSRISMSGENPPPFLVPGLFRSRHTFAEEKSMRTAKLEINVERTIEYAIDGEAHQPETP